MAAIIAFLAYNIGSQIKNLEIKRKSDKNIPPTSAPLEIPSPPKSTSTSSSSFPSSVSSPSSTPKPSSSPTTPRRPQKTNLLHTLKTARLRFKSQESFAKEQKRFNREMKILKEAVEKDFGEWDFGGYLDLYGGEIEGGEDLTRVGSGDGGDGGKLRRVRGRGKRVRFSMRDI